MQKVHLVGLGCAKNLIDSELMMGALAGAGYRFTDDPREAHVLVVNTCAFIESAKRESVDAILEAAAVKKERADCRLVVAGCLAQRYGAELRELLPEVDVFVGTGNFLDLPDLLRISEPSGGVPVPYPGAAHLLPGLEAPRLRTGPWWTAYLKVSEGCDHRCAFCIIPKIRGRHESRPLSAVVEEARRLVADGAKEINLIAQDLTAYGRDLRPRSSLAELLRALAQISGLRWIRLLYCYPNFVTDELLDTIAELPQVVDYIDMPLQHADDGVLRAMRRERSSTALRNLLDRIRKRVPGIRIRTSFIVGFPGETEAAFERLLDFIREQEFDRVGVFTYSREEGTAAYDMPGQIPETVKRARKARVMELQAEIARKLNRSMVGQEVEVLVESENRSPGAQLRGRTPWQAPEIDGHTLLRGHAAAGEIVRARIERASTYDLHARVVEHVT